MSLRFTDSEQHYVNGLKADIEALKHRIADLELAKREVSDRHALLAERDELRRKLDAAHRELARRHRRDEEIAQHLPAIAARLQSLAADAAADIRAPAQEQPQWDRDPAIDWTGIEGGRP